MLIGELLQRSYELPAYSTLNDAAEDALVAMQERLFNLVVTRAPIEVVYKLKELLETDFGRRQSDFNALKQAPKKPSRKHLEVLIDHMAWLESFGNLDAILMESSIPKSATSLPKLRRRTSPSLRTVRCRSVTR